MLTSFFGFILFCLPWDVDNGVVVMDQKFDLTWWNAVKMCKKHSNPLPTVADIKESRREIVDTGVGSFWMDDNGRCCIAVIHGQDIIHYPPPCTSSRPSIYSDEGYLPEYHVLLCMVDPTTTTEILDGKEDERQLSLDSAGATAGAISEAVHPLATLDYTAFNAAISSSATIIQNGPSSPLPNDPTSGHRPSQFVSSPTGPTHRPNPIDPTPHESRETFSDASILHRRTKSDRKL